MLLTPFLDIVPSPLGDGSNSSLESIRQGLMSDSEAQWLIWVQGLLCGIQAIMGVKCIKEGGAVLKQSLDLITLPSLLIY